MAEVVQFRRNEVTSDKPIGGDIRYNPFPQDSILYFPAYEVPLYMHGKNNAYAIKDHKAIARAGGDNNPVLLGIVGKNYKVIQNKELFNAVEDQFIESMTDEQLSGVIVKDKWSYQGAMCFREYIFPKVARQINDKSNVAFRTIVINGFDGSSSFKMISGAIDFFCTNGLIIGSFDMTVKRHSSGLNIPSMVERVKRSVEVFYTQADIWRHWVNKTVSDEDAKKVFESIPNISERRVEQLMRQFHIECMTHGRTVWAMYSAATYYATHDEGVFKTRDTNADHLASTLHNREMQVRSWLNTNEFKQIAA